MREIAPKEINSNTFKMIGDDWMLITAAKNGKVNTMTASWGGLGVFCGKDVTFTFIRPQRYTKEFVDSSATFSISILPEQYRQQLGYLGKVSGRDEDKISKSGLTTVYDGNTPYFAEADTVIICKKMCAADLCETDFIQKKMCDKWFTANDYHTVYISEIVKILTK